MAVLYTLEEAATKLGISPEEMKRRLKTDSTFKILTPIRDGSSVRFKQAAVDELARQLGGASDPELPLAPLDESAELGSDDFKVAGPKKASPKPAAEEPLLLGGSDDDIEFSLSTDDSAVAPKPKKSGSDSDVRLEAAKAAASGEPGAVPTEEIALDVGGPGSAVIKSGSSAKLSPPNPKSSTKLSALSDSGKNLANPGSGDSSEFELSLDADSDDFELQLNTDSSDEVNLGAVPKDKGGKSGINLRDPADSGISLEKKGKKKDSDSDIDFDLSLEPTTKPKTNPKSNPKAAKPNRPAPVTSDSDSEFELTLDDSGGGSSLEQAALPSDEADKNDIFETDFEIPPMAEDSSSEAVEADTDLEKSDFELALNDSDVPADEESGSQVVLLEEESRPAARRRGAVAEDVDLADVESEETGSLSGVMRKESRRQTDDDEEMAVPAGAVASRPWGPWPAVLLALAFLPIALGGLMGYELLHTMWGYSQPRKPAAPLVRQVASAFDMELKDQ